MPTTPAQRRVDARLVATIALGVGIGLIAFNAVIATLGRLQGLLIAVFISLFLSFAMEPAVGWLSQRGMRRGLATIIVFLLSSLLLAGFLAAMATMVVGQARTLTQSIPTIIQDLSSQAEAIPGAVGEELAAYLDEAATQERRAGVVERVGEGILGVGTTLLGGIVQLLTILLVTFYMVADGPRLRRTLSSFVNPRRQAEILTVWELAIEKTGGYVYGRVLVAVASTIFHVAVFAIIGLPYAIALGVWVGVISSLIPVIGTYLAGALPAAIALAFDPVLALWVLLGVVIYQQIENYLLMPRITAHTMELHPAVAFLAVLAGAALFGGAGALLALPVAAVLGGIVSAMGERHEVVDHALHDGPVPRRRASDLETERARQRPEQPDPGASPT